MSKNKKSKQSQSDQQESLQTEQASNSSEVVDQKTEILELKPASSSQKEQVSNSSEVVNQKTEIIELKSPSSSQRESQAENQQVKSTMDNQETDKTSKPKPAIKLKKPQKKESSPPPYKNLETATNQNGEIFAVGEKIKINTCNFGEYTVEIKFLYETADGSIWVTYYPFGDPRSTTAGEEGQKHPWRRGCQRLELLKKPDSQENSKSGTDAVSQKNPDSVPAD